MPTVRELLVRFGVDVDTRQLDEMNQLIETSVGKFNILGIKAGRALTGVGKAISLRVSLPLAALGALFVKTSADAEESEAKFDAVFKEMSADVRAWSKEFGQAIGRNDVELRTFLSQLQDVFVPLGFTRKRASELSVTLTKLAVDLASFNNIAEAETIDRLTSAIVGNIEAVRILGIVITQNVLDQELLRQGIKGGINAATEHEKAFARLTIIIRSSRDAIGDAERTSKSFVNTMRRLLAVLKTLSIDFGDIIKQKVRPFLDGLISIVTAVNSLNPAIKEWIVNLAIGAASIGPLIIAVGLFVTALFTAIAAVTLWKTLARVIRTVAIQSGFLSVRSFLVRVGLLGISSAAKIATASLKRFIITTGPLLAAFALLGLAIFLIIIRLDKFKAVFTELGLFIRDRVRANLALVKRFFSNTFADVGRFFSDFISAWKAGLAILPPSVRRVANAIFGGLRTVASFVGGIFSRAAKKVAGVSRNVAAGLASGRDAVRDVFKGIGDDTDKFFFGLTEKQEAAKRALAKTVAAVAAAGAGGAPGVVTGPGGGAAGFGGAAAGAGAGGAGAPGVFAPNITTQVTVEGGDGVDIDRLAERISLGHSREMRKFWDRQMRDFQGSLPVTSPGAP